MAKGQAQKSRTPAKAGPAEKVFGSGLGDGDGLGAPDDGAGVAVDREVAETPTFVWRVVLASIRSHPGAEHSRGPPTRFAGGRAPAHLLQISCISP